MEFKNLLLERDGRVATITINRPEAMNVLNRETLDELEQVIRNIERDSDIGAVIITGAGDKAFVGGADIGELKALENPMAGVELARRANKLLTSLEELSKPVIAAINGFALGGGLELALACDIRLAADTARLGLTETSLGVIPGNGGTQRLPRLVGKGMAKYLIYTGKRITAREALELRIVEKVYPAQEMPAKAKELAADLASRAPIALALAKRAINTGLDTDLATGCAMEAHYFGIVTGTEDAKEGAGAFFEKRPALFKGR